MIKVKNFLKLILALFLFPIADPQAFFILFSLLFLVSFILTLPVMVFGLLIGLGLQFSNYTVSLWNHSDYDTKLLVIVGIIGIAAFTALPVGVSVFKKIRKYAWSQLEKNNIHHRGKNFLQTVD